jgi:N-acetylglucosaminyl-diphospho-decaprenol L-rhamnosyltransferase
LGTSAPPHDALAVVVVTHESAERLPGLLPALTVQLREGDELVVVDNGSNDGTPELVRRLAPGAALLEPGENVGFAAGCNEGARETRAALLLLLNPDCRPSADCLLELRRAAAEHPEWAAWQAMVLLDPAHINTSGGVVHFLGVGWAGECGQPLSDSQPHEREIAFPSGAAMVVRREAWSELGGFDPSYFMYGEDLDLGLRLWLTGQRVGLRADARVVHGYEFDKGSSKWFLLERNRWRTVISLWPAPLLALLAPAFIAFELVLLAVAARQGWLGAKLRADLAVISGLRSSLARRRTWQARRRIGAREFAGHLTASLSSPYLASAGPALERMQALYWRAVLRALTLVDR